MGKENKLSRNRKARIVLIVLCVIVFAVAAVFFIPKENTGFDFLALRGRITAEKYLDALCRQDYQKASKYVFLYNGTPDDPAPKGYESAWAERVEVLGENRYQYYIVSYDDLHVVMSDGQLTGSVRISVVSRGLSMSYETQLLFRDGRIADITAEDVRTEMEDALSGDISDLIDQEP